MQGRVSSTDSLFLLERLAYNMYNIQGVYKLAKPAFFVLETKEHVKFHQNRKTFY